MPDTAAPLPKLYQLPALDAWQVQHVDTLCTIGLSTMNVAMTNSIAAAMMLSWGFKPELREYVSIIRACPQPDGHHLVLALEQISAIADQARKDSGRYT